MKVHVGMIHSGGGGEKQEINYVQKENFNNLKMEYSDSVLV